MQSGRKLRLGLIGAGTMSGAHLEVYAQNHRVEVMGIADPNLEAAREMAAKYSIPFVTDDYSKILQITDIEAVDICAPHYLHSTITIDAFRAGKDVICEKPIATSLDAADAMIGEAQRAGRRFFVALNERFLPVYTKAKVLMAEGVIGRPFLAVGSILGNELVRMNDPLSWKGTWDKAGGGALADSGTHMIDLMQFLFGAPLGVCARAERLVAGLPNKADDNSIVTFKFPGDLMASLVVSYSIISQPWSERMSIYGTEGSLQIVNEAENPLVLAKNGETGNIPVEHAATWWPYSVSRCLNHFIDCLLEDTSPIVRPEDARRTLATILNAYQSSASGQWINCG